MWHNLCSACMCWCDCVCGCATAFSLLNQSPKQSTNQSIYNKWARPRLIYNLRMYAPWLWFIFRWLPLFLLSAQVSFQPHSSIPGLTQCLVNRAMSDTSPPATPQDPRVNRGNRVLRLQPSTGCTSSIAESDLEKFRKFHAFALQSLICPVSYALS